MGQFGQNPHTLEHIDGLKKELEIITDPEKRTSVLYALVRLLERRPGHRDEAFAFLDEAHALSPDVPDFAFEAWRAAYNRTPDKKLDALNAIFPHLENETDRMHVHLLRAQLLYEQGAPSESVSEALEAAKVCVPDSRKVMWATILTQAAEQIETLANELEQLALVTADPIFEATLLFECAALKHRIDSDPQEIDRLLSMVLAIPNLDWTLLDGVYRLSCEAGIPTAGAAALEMLAAAAMSDPPVDRHAPPSHRFTGHKRGPGIAAGYEWLRAQLLTKELGDMNAAGAAIKEARRLLPKNRYLYLDEALLLESQKEFSPALSLLKKTTVPAERKAITSLAAGQHDDALTIGLSARERPAGLFGEIIAEAISHRLSPPYDTASNDVRLAWLEATPHHADAQSVARNLAEEGISSPFIKLFLAEQEQPSNSILSVADTDPKAPWSHALNAFLGPSTIQPHALLQLAGDTLDPYLKSTFMRCAQMLLPAGEQTGEALTQMITELESNRDPDVAFSPTEENFKKVVAAITADAKKPDDAQLTQAYLKTIILLFSLSEPKQAQSITTQLRNRFPSDPATTLLDLIAGHFARDFRTVTDAIESIRRQVPDDASLFDMLLGELFLLGTHDFSSALACFNRCIDKQENIQEMAIVYRLLTLHLMEDKAEIEKLLTPLETEATKGEGHFADLFTDVFEDARHQNAIRVLEGTDPQGTLLSGCRLAFLHLPENGPAAVDTIHRQLSEIIETTPTGSEKELFNATRSLLRNEAFQLDHLENMDHSFLEELLWYENSGDTSVHPHKIASSTPFDDQEWIDWMLSQAEDEAASGQYHDALETLHQALKRTPDHLGLNESRAIFSRMTGRFTEAVDAHGRLVQLFDSSEEKTHHLSQAAIILLDKLAMPQSARHICESTLRRFPEHARSSDAIAYVLDATFDLPPLSIPKAQRSSTPPPHKTSKDQQLLAGEKQVCDLMAQNETADALLEVNRLLMDAPKRVSLHRYKMDLLTHEKWWEEALIAANLYLEAATQIEEQRSIVIRAATIARDLQGDAIGAISWLKRLRENGAPFLEAEKRIFVLANQADLRGEIEAVRETIEQMAENEPANSDAAAFLKHLKEKRGNS